MADFNAALSAAAGNPGHPPRMKVILELLTADEQAQVEAAVADLSIPPAQIARALTAMGHDISEGAVRTWRRRMESAQRQNNG